MLSWALLLLAACGDDAGGDRTPGDGGADAGGGTSGPGKIPRRPVMTPVKFPIKTCNRFDPLACGAGEECHVLVRRALGEDQFSITTGCVEDVQGRALGAPCDPWGGFGLTYQVPELLDEVHVDPCDEGLFCAPDAVVRSAYSCQRACDNSNGIGCSSATQFCLATADDPFEDVCFESDACDPASVTDCGPGRGCYLRLNDSFTGVLSLCLTTAEMPAEDGESCASGGSVSLSGCRAGSSCWGPVALPPERWTEADYLCRRSCDLGTGVAASDADAGVEGGASGACGVGAECVDVSVAGLEIASGASLGQCR